jgi:hypothetical protein
VAKDPYTTLKFPLAGISEHDAFTYQWDGTCVDARNVRGYDPRTGRLRGSQRAGHSRYVSTQVNGSSAVQHITHVAVSADYSGSGTVSRQTTQVAVAGGTVKKFTSSGYTAITNGTTALSSTYPWIQSAILFQQLFFADGVSAKYYDIPTNTISTWTPSAGSLPTSGGKYCRLICNWRGRVFQSGLVGDDHNWFASRQDNGFDWDYGSSITDDQQPVAGNNAPAGKCPDIVTSLIPYRDDILIFGGDSSVWQMTNDPASGGRIDLVSDITGVAYGNAWCKDPSGVLYFFGSRGGLYGMVPGSQPQLLSNKRMQERMAKVDLSTTKVELAWDDRQQTVMIYCTDLSGATSIHFAYDTRSQAFWMDRFLSVSHNPSCVHVFDGDLPGDRALLLGCRDGYIRKIDVDAKSDDTEAIESYAFLGPFQGGSGKLKLRETRLSAGENSDRIAVGVHCGPSPEAAFGAQAMSTFMHDPNSEIAHRTGGVGNAIYLKLSNTTYGESWSFESGSVRFDQTGAAAGRRV